MEQKKIKKWVVKADPLEREVISKIALSLGCSNTLATLIFNRGYKDKESACAFLEKSQEILHSPFLLNDMEKATSRIITAVKNNEKITVYGDYDVDGVTSVSILYLYLKSIGADVSYYIPSRKGEGYGVSKDAIDALNEKGTRLIITVDTGVTAIDEVAYARELNIDVVVTDHHECTETLPCAVAVINPKRKGSTYPFTSLAGVGVVFKLLCALEKEYSKIDLIDATRKIAYEYSDLTAIGTIADVMPVIDENRIIISLGLIQAENTSKVGLRALIDMCRSGDGKSQKTKKSKKLSSGFVGFTLAPRINAAGRINSADLAVDLFLEADKIKAERLAEELCELNKERQHTENRIAEEAYQLVEAEENANNKSILVLDNYDWHSGVIGIVSSRVTDRYGVPSILITFEGNEDPYSPEAIGKGSGRSIGGMNLVEALNYCSPLLEKYGGHELAAGLSIKRKNLDEFKKKIESFAEEYFKNAQHENTLSIDCELDFNDLSLELAKEVSLLEPYGVSNPTPVFVSRGAVLSGISPVGMNRHLRLTLENYKKKVCGMLFSTAPQDFELTFGDEVDVVYNLEINEFNGSESLQINIKDIRISQSTLDFELENEKLYQEVKMGSSALSAEEIIPTREDFSYIYQFLQSNARYGKRFYRYTKLLSDINSHKSFQKFNFVKLKTIIKVFRELNIIYIEEIDDFTFEFKFSGAKNKTSLDKSSILKKLKQAYLKR